MKADVALMFIDALIFFFLPMEKGSELWPLKPIAPPNHQRLTALSPTEESVQLFPEVLPVTIPVIRII